MAYLHVDWRPKFLALNSLGNTSENCHEWIFLLLLNLPLAGMDPASQKGL